MQLLTDVTDVRARCASEDEGNEPVTMSLGLLRAIIQERDAMSATEVDGKEEYKSWPWEVLRADLEFES